MTHTAAFLLSLASVSADEAFKANVAKHKTYYESLRAQLGIVDFNPLTVDWTTPVPWGNDPDNCKMEDSSGCLMPLGAGFGIVLVFREGKFGHVKMTSEHFNTAGRDVKTGLTA